MSTAHHDRSIAAEARGVEENHHARLIHDADGAAVLVKSDSVDGRTYRVAAHVSGEGHDVLWTCKPSDLHQPGRIRDHGLKCSNDGTTPCKHMTRAARRLERAGLVRWVDPHVDQGIAYAGRWVAARATSPVVVDELAPAGWEHSADGEPCTSGPERHDDALCSAHGRLLRPAGASDGRRATDAPGYRRVMATTAPVAGDPFAGFPR